VQTGTRNVLHPNGSCNPSDPNYACGPGRLQVIPSLSASYSPQNSNAQLSWELESFFRPGDIFYIERSKDDETYKIIGLVDQSNMIASTYTFIDNYPFQIGYYRLTFISTTGKAFSQTITVVSVNNDKLYLMPNPATTTLRVLLTNMQAYETELSVHDFFGRQLIFHKLSKGQNEINISRLPQGTYIMKAKMNGNTYMSRFVKN
jgi:hypothetical protein